MKRISFGLVALCLAGMLSGCGCCPIWKHGCCDPCYGSPYQSCDPCGGYGGCGGCACGGYSCGYSGGYGSCDPCGVSACGYGPAGCGGMCGPVAPGCGAGGCFHGLVGWLFYPIHLLGCKHGCHDRCDTCCQSFAYPDYGYGCANGCCDGSAGGVISHPVEGAPNSNYSPEPATEQAPPPGPSTTYLPPPQHRHMHQTSGYMTPGPVGHGSRWQSAGH